MTRDPAVESFLSSVRDVLATRCLGTEGTAAIDRIYGALCSPGCPGSGRIQRLPVCGDCLPEAFATARRHSPALARIVDAFQAIEPALFWTHRGKSGPHASTNWPEGHANAVIVGPDGLESRNDVTIGVLRIPMMPPGYSNPHPRTVPI